MVSFTRTGRRQGTNPVPTFLGKRRADVRLRAVSVLDQLSEWPVPSAAAGVTNADEALATGGAMDAVQPWASVTKLVTAYGVLRLLEVGQLDLDEPAGPPGSTIRHLLAHASGLNFEGNTVIGPPGRRRIYSSGGFDVLGGLVAQRTGQSIEAYLAEAVFQPLRMTSCAIRGSCAADGFGSARDLLSFARELLAPTLVAPETLAEATTVAFPGLSGVLPGYGRRDPNDWGLGFEIRDGKDPHWTGATNSPSTFGHFGQQGSFLWVDPAIGIGCVALTSRLFGKWALTAWPRFSDAVVASYGSSRGER
jgi:CubicO group peptidase (beta-lactamase class C family)